MKYVLIALLAITTLHITSCKETDSALNMANNERMKDSVFRAMPSIRYIEIKIQESSDVTIVCGSKQLYNAADEKRQEIANKLAEITYFFHNEHNYLDEGKVRFVPVEDRIPTDTDPAKENDMHLQEIVKAHKK
jgi:hypothetical protein